MKKKQPIFLSLYISTGGQMYKQYICIFICKIYFYKIELYFYWNLGSLFSGKHTLQKAPVYELLNQEVVLE